MHYMRWRRGGGRPERVGGPAIRTKAVSLSAEHQTPERIRQLSRWVCHLGERFFAKSSTRGRVLLVSRYGLLEIGRPTLQSMRQRGFVEVTKTDVRPGVNQIELTPAGRNALPNFAPTPVDPMDTKFHCLSDVLCAGAPPDPKKVDRYFANGYVKPRGASRDPISDGFLGTLFLRVGDEWREVAALQEVGDEMLWHIDGADGEPEAMHADQVVERYLGMKELAE